MKRIISISIILTFFACSSKNDCRINGIVSNSWTEKSLETQILIVDSLVNSGSLNYEQELLKYDTLVDIAESFNLNQGLQNTYRRIGCTYMRLGNLQKSTDYLIKSATISSQINDTLALLSTLSNIGNVYQYFNLPDKALVYLDSAHQGYLKQDYHPIYLSSSFYNLSEHYSELGNHQKAAEYGKQSYSKIKSIPKSTAYLKADSLYYWLQWIKELSCLNKNVATDSFTAMLPNIAAQNNSTIKLESYGFGLNLFPPSKSSIWIDSILYFMDTETENDTKKFTFIKLAEYYKKIKQFDSAFKYQEMAVMLKDSFYGIKSLETIANITSAYEQLTNKEVKLLQVQQKTQNTWLTALALTLLLLCIVGFLYFQNAKNKRKKVVAENSLNINKLIEEVNQTKMEAWADGQEKERSRIANELHDRLGGVLAMASHHFNSVEAQFELMKKQNNSALADLKKLLNNAIIEVRELSKDISSNMVNKLGLSNALAELIDTVQNASELMINFKTHQTDCKIPLNKEIALYRVAQEALNNIMKHAKATTVEVSLVANEGSLILMIEDNGVGFDNNDKLINSLGLKSMQKRVEDLNGKFTIDSTKLRGTTVISEIPI